jgi:hypothetical protein
MLSFVDGTVLAAWTKTGITKITHGFLTSVSFGLTDSISFVSSVVGFVNFILMQSEQS